jgi:hypothetical protein
MAIRFVLYTTEWEPAVARFNRRMKEGDAAADFDIPSRAVTPTSDLVRNEHWLAVEDDEVRGGMIILTHPAWIDDSAREGGSQRVETVTNYQSPLSEGLIDPKYALVSAQLIRFALKQCRYAYVVGMGHEERPVARLLKAAGFTVRPVPFFFKVLRAGRALPELQPLRRKPLLRAAALFAAYTGTGTLALGVLQRSRVAVGALRVEEITSATNDDATWAALQRRISFGVVRNSATIPRYLSREIKRFAVSDARGHAGWFSLMIAPMRNHSYFGNLTVATIVDVVSSRAEDTAPMVALATEEARAAGCDLVVSNQLAVEMRLGFRAAGFLSYTSNYLLATSKALSAAMDDDSAFVTRQDGDGLVNLRGADARS